MLQYITGVGDTKKIASICKKYEYAFFEEMFWINKSVAYAIGLGVLKKNDAFYKKMLKNAISLAERA